MSSENGKRERERERGEEDRREKENVEVGRSDTRPPNTNPKRRMSRMFPGCND